jgi:hypothetical protein
MESLIKITSFFSQRKFRVSVGRRNVYAKGNGNRAPQSSVLSQTLYSMYKNEAPPPNTRYFIVHLEESYVTRNYSEF